MGKVKDSINLLFKSVVSNIWESIERSRLLLFCNEHG